MGDTEVPGSAGVSHLGPRGRGCMGSCGQGLRLGQGLGLGQWLGLRLGKGKGRAGASGAAERLCQGLCTREHLWEGKEQRV